MKTRLLAIVFTSVLIIAAVFTYLYLPTKEAKKLSRVETKKLRSDYFFNKLKDPKTQSIPTNIRAKELAFSARLKSQQVGSRSSELQTVNIWNEIGPSDVGGRTRTIALDIRNSNTVLIGGVSGGVWKTTNGGTTWTSKLPSGSHLSISSIAQDPINKDTWYATTGELQDGGSASGKGYGYNPYLGAGIYKSTDNGENWSLLTYEQDGNNNDKYVQQSSPETRPTSLLVSPFQLTGKVLIHDFNGTSSIFITTQYQGIWVSTDNAASFFQFGNSLTNDEDPYYSDIVVDQNDVITLWFGPTESSENGFFRSYDRGENFFNLTPNSYPAVFDNARTVLALSPSSPEILYAFIYDGSNSVDNSHLFRFNYTNIDNGGTTYSTSNRTSNLPVFSESIFGGTEDFTTQGGYDMTIAVHPTNPNFVVLGYVNLVKSEDGFSTAITSNPAKYWIGGNDNPWLLDEGYSFSDENVHHADQHMLVFDPNDPNVLWSAHDGGISKTLNVTANRVIWEGLNNDYNVTQFYTVSAGFADGDSYVIGGTQDNGTPVLDHSSYISNLLPNLVDLSSGDGAFCYAGNELIYSSAQNGYLSLFTVSDGFFHRFFVREDLTTLFIHPFAVDPNDEGTLFFSTFGDGIIARNTAFDEGVAAQDISIIEDGWEDFSYGNEVAVTAIRVSDQNPSHKLYFGGNIGQTPVLLVWENANTAANLNNLDGWELEDVAEGAWLNDIAINPANGEEILLVYSNYNITGLFHSSDGGLTLTAIEGNLSDNDDLGNFGFTGPSMRAAEIGVDNAGNKTYYVATSIGLFSTSTLNGMNTVWEIETSMLDNVVIEDLDFRKEDGAVVAGTHGRGIFLGVPDNTNNAPLISAQTFEIEEKSEQNTIVGTVTASDEDGDELSFEIVSGNTGQTFAINETSGILTVLNPANLIFDINQKYDLNIQVSDGSLTDQAIITVNVIEIPLGVPSVDFVSKIYPNPATGGEINIDFREAKTETIEVSLINLTGQSFSVFKGSRYNTNSTIIDVTRFAGHYVLEVKSASHSSRKKVIIAPSGYLSGGF